MIKTYKFSEVSPEEIFDRKEEVFDVSDTVSEIIDNVRKNGDEALRFYSRKFDKTEIDAFEVTDEEIDAAMAQVDKKLIEVMELAKKNITEYHEKQKRADFEFTRANGAVLGQKITAIEKVGVYVPGGTAALPSSALMNIIPAKIAGVDEVVMVSPPTCGGSINPVILAAAKIAGVDRIFKVGGAQAIAALAYGTESIPKVYKIVGPGNAFVAEAKRQVFGRVAIDMIAGPSEILVIADGSNDAKVLAADLLSQAEHDKRASAVLVTDSEELAAAVSAELERQIPLLPRAEIARTSIDNNGMIIIADDLKKVVEISNELAPEHLEVCVEKPFELLPSIRNAGSIFLGKYCPEPLGDYLSGTNHVLPTGGTARFSSPLSVDDFIKKSCYSYYTEDALREICDDVACFAESEGLSAHARSATVRFEK